MLLKKTFPQILLGLIILLTACKGDVKLDKILNDDSEKIESIGTKHFLEENGIQLQLPENFKRLSIAEYSEILDKKSNQNKFIVERTAFEDARSLDGNGYVFFNEEENDTYMINAIPYAEIKKEDAQKLLGIIRQNHKEIAEKSNVAFEKMTAKFKDITTGQIFKAVFKADFKNPERTQYQHPYFINSKGKSVLIKLITSKDINFDKYIEKMIF